MRNPPPEPPREPFLLVRTPPSGTLLGLQALPLPPAPPPAGVARGPAPAPDDALERQLVGLRLELASFREWLPGQLARPRPRPRPVAVEERWRHALVALAGAALALALAFASASAALGWPAYARLVASATRLGAAPPHSR